MEHTIPDITFDCIFVCDCGELRLVGKLLEENAELFANTPIIDIDHHNRNSLFGSVNLVDTEASSTCELVYELISHIPEYTGHLDRDISACLIHGIIRDTNCFKNSIRPRTFAVVGALYALNPKSYEEIIFRTYKSESLNYLQLYSETMSKSISLK